MKKFILFLIVTTLLGCQRNKKLNTVERSNGGPEMIYLKHFGDMDCSDDPTTMWQKFVTINNQKFPLELNYPIHSNKKSLFLKNESTLEELEDIIEKSRKDLFRDYNKKGITKEFIATQLEGFEKEDYEFHKIDNKQKQKKKEIALLNTIKLRRVGIFLVDSENHLVLSYYIPNKVDYLSKGLLVIKYNKKFKLSGITTQR